MPAKKYIIALTAEERQQIEIVARSYRHSARERSRAKILLLADENQPEGCSLKDREIAEQLGCTPLHIEKTRQKAIERGAIESLKHKPQERRRARKLDGAAEAKLTSLACSQTPEGRKTWTLQMLADQLIQMKVVDSVSDTTIYRTMKKTRSNPG
jgi:Fe2+ transport system protein B